MVRAIVVGPRVFTLGSWWRFVLLGKLGARQGGRRSLVPLAVRWLEGQTIHVRPGTADWDTLNTSLIGKYHRPPAEAEPVQTILDLGSNIGVTIADLAACHPGARILGIELDASNVALARRNTARWSDRVAIVHGAAWTSDSRVPYGGSQGEHGYRVVAAMSPERLDPAIAEVPAHSMSGLIDRLSHDGSVDYVKMDVEGTEAFLLAEGDDWADRVRCLKVEVHRPYDVPRCFVNSGGWGSLPSRIRAVCPA